MKKTLFTVFSFILFILASQDTKAQTTKFGVFDIDVMVQAMPGYHIVDSLVQIYNTDSLNAERQVYESEFQRLDSMYKIDSALFAQGKQTKAKFDYTTEQRRTVGLNLVYWQQIAQSKSNNKRGEYARPLYEVVIGAYKKILDRKKYALVLKPQAYEAGTTVDNVFILVAKELKLTELPQQLVDLGPDPDAAPAKQPAKPATGVKPKTK